MTELTVIARTGFQGLNAKTEFQGLNSNGPKLEFWQIKLHWFYF